jgi:hypothetical protein
LRFFKVLSNSRTRDPTNAVQAGVQRPGFSNLHRGSARRGLASDTLAKSAQVLDLLGLKIRCRLPQQFFPASAPVDPPPAPEGLSVSTSSTSIEPQKVRIAPGIWIGSRSQFVMERYWKGRAHKSSAHAQMWIFKDSTDIQNAVAGRFH